MNWLFTEEWALSSFSTWHFHIVTAQITTPETFYHTCVFKLVHVSRKLFFLLRTDFFNMVITRRWSLDWEYSEDSRMILSRFSALQIFELNFSHTKISLLPPFPFASQHTFKILKTIYYFLLFSVLFVTIYGGSRK